MSTLPSKILLIILLCVTAGLILFYSKKQTLPTPLTEAILPPRDDAFKTFSLAEPTFPNKACTITNYGAIGNGVFNNTDSIKKAILDCEENGGGKVVVPDGEWLTGPIVLKSNINLFLEKNAHITFSRKFSDYLPVVFSRFEGTELYNYSPLIYANDAKNVAITGEGTMNGNGKAWKNFKSRQNIAAWRLYTSANAGVAAEKRVFGTEKDALRPSFIQFVNSRNILIENVTVTNSPMWTIHPVYSENVTIRNVKIDSDGPNTDGIVIDSSKNVIVDGVTVKSGDDAIAIKSGKDRDGLTVNKPSENIIVRNSTIQNGHSGLAIGSEMSGGVRNVLFENSTIDAADFGIQIKSMRGRGGTVENIWSKNINIRKATEQAIRIDMRYGTPIDPTSPVVPVFKNISFQNINCKRASDAIILKGLPDSPIQSLRFDGIEITSSFDIQEENTKDTVMENVNIILSKKQTR